MRNNFTRWLITAGLIWSVSLLAFSLYSADKSCNGSSVIHRPDSWLFMGDTTTPVFVDLNAGVVVYVNVLIDYDNRTHHIPNENNIKPEYRVGGINRESWDGVIIALVDYIVACGTNWKAKRWQDLLIGYSQPRVRVR